MPAIFTRQEAERAKLLRDAENCRRIQSVEAEEIRKAEERAKSARLRFAAAARNEAKYVQQAAAIKPSAVRKLPAIEHDWFTPQCSRECIGCQWCAGGLEMCRLCGAFEGATTTHCPQVQVGADTWDKVYAGQLDYRFGRWINWPSRLSPEWWKMIGERLGWRQRS